MIITFQSACLLNKGNGFTAMTVVVPGFSFPAQLSSISLQMEHSKSWWLTMDCVLINVG